MEYKRLKKDLPFDYANKGVVIVKGSRGHGRKYSITNRTTYHEEGGSSSGGLTTFSTEEEDVLDTIWSNDEWFEEAKLEEVKLRAYKDNIVIEFDSIDQEHAEEFARGIIHILKHLGDKPEKGGYVWNRYKDIKGKMK